MKKYPHYHKVLITGERYWDDQSAWDGMTQVIRALRKRHKKLLIICGAATGIDSVCIRVCAEEGVHCATIKALWSHPQMGGRKAGPIRNQVMYSLLPAEVIGFHRNLAESKGTRNALQLARRYGIPARLHRGG